MNKKSYIWIIFILILCLQSCVITKGVKFGNASVDDYSIFKQDTVHNGLQTFHFARNQENEHLIDTLKFDIYLSKSDTILNLTLRETMDYMDVPSAAVIHILGIGDLRMMNIIMVEDILKVKIVLLNTIV